MVDGVPGFECPSCGTDVRELVRHHVTQYSKLGVRSDWSDYVDNLERKRLHQRIMALKKDLMNIDTQMNEVVREQKPFNPEEEPYEVLQEEIERLKEERKWVENELDQLQEDRGNLVGGYRQP